MKTIVLLICFMSASLASGARVTHIGSKAYQSSIFNNKGILLGPERALDRNYDNNFPNPDLDSCTHTNDEQNPWWAVDLQKPYKIESLRITSRSGFESRLTNFIVGVSNNHPKQVAPVLDQYEVCSKYVGAPPAGLITIQCSQNIQASRFVFIQIPAKGMLELCEVEIYVTDYNILKPSLFTYQSSALTLNGRLLHPFLGINQDYTNSFSDANQDTCTHSNNIALQNWWAVELDVPYHITSVKLVLRKEFKDRATGVTIGVTDVSPLDVVPTPENLSSCGHLQGAPSADVVTITCEQQMPAAKVVVIQLPGQNFLELCEVEVFGDHV